ncbi:MAG: hypothetical protein U0235_15735 [Polyangiaceae bacterium]
MLRSIALLAALSSLSIACSAPEALGEASSALDDGPPPAGTSSGGIVLPAPSPAAAKLDYANPQIRAISAPENITSLATGTYGHGRFRSAQQFYPSPFVDGFMMLVNNVGGTCGRPESINAGCFQTTFATDFETRWDAGSFTGFRPPQGFQYGYLDVTGAPSLTTAQPAYQLYGTEAGILINTRTFDHLADLGSPPSAELRVAYGNPETPFRHETSELTLQSLVRVPSSIPSNGGAGQISFVFLLRDTKSGEGIEFVAKVMDSRSDDGVHEAIGDRVNGVTTVRTSLISGGRYATVSPFSNQTRYASSWGSLDFFRVHVSGAQLADVARVVRANSGSEVSTRPSDWVLARAGIRQEAIVGTTGGREMLLGASYRELSVYEFF